MARAALLLALVACGRTIGVPVRPCIVEGTAWSRAPQTIVNLGGVAVPTVPSAPFDQQMAKVNDVWRQADLAFATYYYGGQRIPVIPSSLPPVFSGGIEVDGASMHAALEACNQVWSNLGPTGANGIAVVIASELYNKGQPGTPSPSKGFAVSNVAWYDASLCRSPRTPHPILQRRFVALPEPGRFGFRGDQRQGTFDHVLAHELGHALMLMHGDGLDNDGNGVFDFACDPPEPEPGVSLMTAVGEPSKLLTALQIAFAREMAVAIPGAIR